MMMQSRRRPRLNLLAAQVLHHPHHSQFCPQEKALTQLTIREWGKRQHGSRSHSSAGRAKLVKSNYWLYAGLVILSVLLACLAGLRLIGPLRNMHGI